jgi:hypothetical protein
MPGLQSLIFSQDCEMLLPDLFCADIILLFEEVNTFPHNMGPQESY